MKVSNDLFSSLNSIAHTLGFPGWVRERLLKNNIKVGVGKHRLVEERAKRVRFAGNSHRIEGCFAPRAATEWDL